MMEYFSTGWWCWLSRSLQESFKIILPRDAKPQTLADLLALVNFASETEIQDKLKDREKVLSHKTIRSLWCETRCILFTAGREIELQQSAYLLQDFVQVSDRSPQNYRFMIWTIWFVTRGPFTRSYSSVQDKPVRSKGLQSVRENEDMGRARLLDKL